jgi:hypothetical protein
MFDHLANLNRARPDPVNVPAAKNPALWSQAVILCDERADEIKWRTYAKMLGGTRSTSQGRVYETQNPHREA